MDRRGLLKRKLESLNDGFFRWVQAEHTARKDELWIEGAEQYVKHANAILEEFKDVINKSGNPAPASSNPFLGAPVANGSAPSAFPWGLDAKKGPAQKEANGVAKPALFGSGTASPSTNPFLPQSQPASGGLFSFGSKPAAPQAQANGIGTNHQASAQDQHDDAAEQDQDDEPTVPAAVDPNAEILFESSGVLYVHNATAEKVWADKGRGRITVRKPGGENAGKPCHLVFVQDTGRLLFNGAFYKGLKPVVKGKGRVMMTLPNAVATDDGVKVEQKIIILKIDDKERDQKVEALVTAVQSNLPQ